jgi:hypothetical protein
MSLTGIQQCIYSIGWIENRGGRSNPPGHTHKRKTAIFNEKLKKASGMQLLILFLQYRVQD